MIGYYVHHVGQGHLQQALAIVAASRQDVTLLSSLSRPRDYAGPWIQLPRDDHDLAPRDPTALGQLHWAPLNDPGLRERMAVIADWIRTARPSVMVVDVSVEVAAFIRLMGVPVIAVVLPGRRGDPAHRLGYALAEELLVPWPQSLGIELADGTQLWAGKMCYTGAFSRFDGRPPAAIAAGSKRSVVLLYGQGGSTLTDSDLDAARAATPEWSWTALGGNAGWVDDPWPALSAADVIVTHAGLNAVAEVAAARKPAIVIPQPRPHDEQVTTARALGAAGIALVLEDWPPAEQWPGLLDRSLRNGERWSEWSSGAGARRAATMIEAVADQTTYTNKETRPG